jgi:hypothetical protein
MKTKSLVGAVAFLAVGAAIFCNGTSSDAAEIGHSALHCYIIGGTLARWYNGQIGNASTTESMTAICPLVADTSQASTGTMHAHVIDASGDDAVTCSSYVTSAYGDNNYWSGWSSSVGEGPTNRRTFTFSSMTDAWGAGNRTIVCTLPPKDTTYSGNDGISRIGSYSSGG